MKELITEDGEIISTSTDITTTTQVPADNSALVGYARAEIDIQIETARKYGRRSPKAIAAQIMELATMDEETAEECLYAMVRGGKRKARPKSEILKAGDAGSDRDNRPIEGPSIRLAEIAASQWGNNRNGYRPISVNRVDKIVVAEGVFHDLESNMMTTVRVSRSIATASGGIYSPDMINQTMNAAGSIAKRNAILQSIPKGVVTPAYRAARAIVVGTASTLVQNRQKCFKMFASFGISPEQIFSVLEIEDESEIGLDELGVLRAMFATLKSGESTAERMFPRAKSKIEVDNPLSDSPIQGNAADDPSDDGETRRDEEL